jgi:hypothetical protein
MPFLLQRIEMNAFLATPGPAMVGMLSIAAGVPVYCMWKPEDDRN